MTSGGQIAGEALAAQDAVRDGEPAAGAGRDMKGERASRVATETWIVIAAYNEAQAIGGVVRQLRERYPNVIVVDDGSGDQTAACALAAGATVLRHLINRGQGAALQTGLRYALREGACYVVTFDADGQHDPADIADLLAPLVAGEVDVCLGSRFLGETSEVPLVRRMVLAAAIVFTWLTSGLRLSDAHNGLRAMSRAAVEKIDIQLDRMAHASEVIDQIRVHQLSFREVPVHIRYTEYSLAKGQKSSAALRVAFDYLIGRLMK